MILSSIVLFLNKGIKNRFYIARINIFILLLLFMISYIECAFSCELSYTRKNIEYNFLHRDEKSVRYIPIGSNSVDRRVNVYELQGARGEATCRSFVALLQDAEPYRYPMMWVREPAIANFSASFRATITYINKIYDHRNKYDLYYSISPFSENTQDINIYSQRDKKVNIYSIISCTQWPYIWVDQLP
jgi:hypothetical protein